MAITKETAKKALRTVNTMIDSIENSMDALITIERHAHKTDNHMWAIKSVSAIKAIQPILDDLHEAQNHYMMILGTNKIHIENKDEPVRLRLVVDNTRKEGVV